MIDRPESERENSDSGDDPASKEHRIAVAVQSITEQQNATNKSADEQHRETIRWAKRTFWAVVGYSFLTFVIAAASVYGARESREAVRQAANAANAAGRQATIAEDTERRQLRAYLSSSSAVVLSVPNQPTDKSSNPDQESWTNPDLSLRYKGH